MTVAQELEKRLFTVADSKMRWVQRQPENSRECCASVTGEAGFEVQSSTLSPSAYEWINNFLNGYVDHVVTCVRCRWIPGEDSITEWNDHVAKNRQEVIWMLEEAVDQAKWEGV